MTIGSGAVREPPLVERRRLFSVANSPLVRAVARAPFSVRTKLLAGFGVIALLLVTVGVLGLVELRQSNARVTHLGELQARAAAYHGLKSDVAQLQGLLLGRANVTPNAGQVLGRGTKLAPTSFLVFDSIISQALASLLDDATTIETTAPTVFQHVYETYARLYSLTRAALLRDATGQGDRLGPLVRKEQTLAAGLAPVVAGQAARAQQLADRLVTQNAQSFSQSRRVFIGVASGSVVLALLLGFVLAGSLIAPLRRTEARLADIAAGDFTGHVDVPNRDEVGVLAANVNRMNDELGRLYREIETISRHKSDFLATMSHELRTPLNAIIGFSEVLREQMFGELNEQQLAYVDDVLAAGRHLLSLINDVLDLAKIEAGRMDLELEPFALAAVLESGMTMHGERASRAGVALGLTLDPAEIVVTADERRVRQVVFNLLSNAITFTPRDGRVDVSARLHDGAVEVAVADTGPGIAADDLDRIFEEFDQGSGARTDGTGLGLPLSRKFVELHGGRLWVESVIGRGSTFTFTLPVKQEAPPWQTS